MQRALFDPCLTPRSPPAELEAQYARWPTLPKPPVVTPSVRNDVKCRYCPRMPEIPPAAEGAENSRGKGRKSGLLGGWSTGRCVCWPRLWGESGFLVRMASHTTSQPLTSPATPGWPPKELTMRFARSPNIWTGSGRAPTSAQVPNRESLGQRQEVTHKERRNKLRLESLVVCTVLCEHKYVKRPV
jgi:hypothetical protein